MGKLSAGVARTIINPPRGTNLCGYAGRIPGNIGVHDDLHAKALVLSDGKTKAAVVTLDLIGLIDEQVARIREEASARTGIPGGNMLIGTSHTHAGPANMDIRACGKSNPKYIEGLLGKIVDVIAEAAKGLRSARFGFGRAQSDIAINRRYRAPSGEVQIGENVGGIIDPEVGIWLFTDDLGKPLATIFNYACHAVTMGGDNRWVSGDWPGAAQRAIEAAVGGQAMYLQGCCGNINPRDRGGFEVVEENGRRMAEAVLGVLPTIRTTTDVTFDIASETIKLPLQPPISMEEAERTVKEMAESLKKKDQMSLGQKDINEAFHDWAQTIIARGGKGKASDPFEVQRFSINDAHIVGLPGEVFIEYALQIKKFQPNVFVAGYANGNVGYVPTAAAFKDGGYEVDLAYKLYGEQMLTPKAEKVILSAAGRLLK